MSAEERTPEIGNWTSALTTIRERMKEKPAMTILNTPADKPGPAKQGAAPATQIVYERKQRLKELARGLQPVSVMKLCEVAKLRGAPDSVEALTGTAHQMIGSGEIPASWIIFPDAARPQEDRDRNKRIAAEYAQDKEKVREIADRYGITKQRVRQIAKRRGVPMRTPQRMASRKSLLRDLARENQPIRVGALCKLAQSRDPAVTYGALTGTVYGMIRDGELPKGWLILPQGGPPALRVPTAAASQQKVASVPDHNSNVSRIFNDSEAARVFEWALSMRNQLPEDVMRILLRAFGTAASQ